MAMLWLCYGYWLCLCYGYAYGYAYGDYGGYAYGDYAYGGYANGNAATQPEYGLRLTLCQRCVNIPYLRPVCGAAYGYASMAMPVWLCLWARYLGLDAYGYAG